MKVRYKPLYVRFTYSILNIFIKEMNIDKLRAVERF